MNGRRKKVAGRTGSFETHDAVPARRGNQSHEGASAAHAQERGAGAAGQQADSAPPQIVSTPPAARGELKRRRAGPRTPAGKARSRYNALGHGIFSDVVVLEGEPRAQFDSLSKGLREDLQPEGTLERVLVESLAVLLWRYRRLLSAEAAEIQKGIRFLQWDEEQRQTERVDEISDSRIGYSRGLIREIANPIVLEDCLDSLKDLKETIEKSGLDPDDNLKALKCIYGERTNLQHNLPTLYIVCSTLAESALSDKKRHRKAVSTPEQPIGCFLTDLEKEIKRLERYKKARASIESERMKLEALRRNVPDDPQLDRLLRYEAHLKRNFDRTLSQLERLQRMRLGQPVAPPINVNVSAS